MERRLAAILSADVVGYSKLMTEDEEATLAQLKAHRADVFDPKIAEHNGRIIKLMGDGTLVEFASVVDAVNCAIGIQSALAETEDTIRLRIGINLGDVIVDGDDIYGDGVNIAARLEALAEPGGVCISDLVHQSIRSKMDVTFVDVGDQELKNIDEPVRVWSWPEALRALSGFSDNEGRKPAVRVARFAAKGAEAEEMAEAVRDDLATTFSRQTALTLVDDAAKADYIVDGAVRASGARWRIIAQLTECASDRRVWSSRYDESGDDVFDIQDRCGFKIASAVRIRIIHYESENLVGRRPEDLTVEELLNLAAKHFMSPTFESFARAASYLEIALARDADNWMAMAMLSFYTMRNQELGWRAISPTDVARTWSVIEGALRLNPNSDVVRFTRAKALLFVNCDHHAARVEIEQALRLNPSYIRSIALLGQIEAHDGNADKALSLARQAVDGDPGHPHLYSFLHQAGVTFAVVGEYTGATEMFMRADLVAPKLSSNLIGLATCRQLAGDADGARAAVEKLLIAAPDFNLAELAPWPFRNPTDWEMYCDALAAIGVPLERHERQAEGGI